MPQKICNNFAYIDFGSIIINDADITFKKASDFFPRGNSFIQFFSIKVVSSREQVFSAIDNALSSFNSKKPFAKRLSLEFLLFLTAQRQLDSALDLLELQKGKNLVGIAVLANSISDITAAKKFLKKELSFTQQTNLPEKNLRQNAKFLQEIFNISENEISCFKGSKEEALKRLVLEKIALLSLKS